MSNHMLFDKIKNFNSGKTAVYIGISWLIVAGIFVISSSIINYESPLISEKFTIATSNNIISSTSKMSFIVLEDPNYLEIYYSVLPINEKPALIAFVIPFDGKLDSPSEGWTTHHTSKYSIIYKIISCSIEMCPADDGTLTYKFTSKIDSFRIPNQYVQIPFSNHPLNYEVWEFIREIEPERNSVQFGWDKIDSEVNLIMDKQFDEWETQPTAKISSYVKQNGKTNIILKWDITESEPLFTAKYSRENDRKFAGFSQLIIGISVGAGITMITTGVALYQTSISQKKSEKYIKFNRHFQDANTAYVLKEFDKAKESYDLAIKEKPDDVNAMLLAGNSFYEMKRYDDAISYYTQILEINPQHLGALTNFGACQAGLGDHEKAIEYYQKALDINPNHMDAINNMGASILDNDFPEYALPYFEEYLKENKSHVTTITNKGKTLHLMKKYYEATECFEKALSINPKWAGALIGRGAVEFDRGEFNNAILCYKQALELEPTNADLLFSIGRCYLELENSDDAIKYFGKFLTIKPYHVEGNQLIGVAYARKGDQKTAHGFYDLVLSIIPNHQDTLYNKALSYMLERHPDLALPLLNQFLSVEPNDVNAITNKGNCFLTLDQPNDAILCFNDALILDPNFEAAKNGRDKALRRISGNP